MYVLGCRYLLTIINISLNLAAAIALSGNGHISKLNCRTGKSVVGTGAD